MLFCVTFVALRQIYILVFQTAPTQLGTYVLIGIAGAGSAFADIWGVLKGDVAFKRAAIGFAVSTLLVFLCVLPFL